MHRSPIILSFKLCNLLTGTPCRRRCLGHTPVLRRVLDSRPAPNTGVNPNWLNTWTDRVRGIRLRWGAQSSYLTSAMFYLSALPGAAECTADVLLFRLPVGDFPPPDTAPFFTSPSVSLALPGRGAPEPFTCGSLAALLCWPPLCLWAARLPQVHFCLVGPPRAPSAPRAVWGTPVQAHCRLPPAPLLPTLPQAATGHGNPDGGGRRVRPPAAHFVQRGVVFVLQN
jgi:hypothetical protein